MSLKHELPSINFIQSFLAAKGLDAGGVNAAINLATDQFKINEQTKEYANAVEKSNMYIGMDIERLIAVDVGAIKVQVAKNRAMYKSELAAAVKNVKTQQAHLEGQFGIDTAAVKKDFALKGLSLTSAMDEDTQTTIAQNEYDSTIMLVGEESASNQRINTSEDTFRRGLSDSDYDATVTIADTRAKNVTARGEVDKTAIVKESAVTDQGLRWSYDIESGGITTTSIVEQGLIQEQGSAERTNILDLSSIKIDSIAATANIEIDSNNQISNNKIIMIGEQATLQVDIAAAMAEINAEHTLRVGELEAEYIGVNAAAQDEAYIYGAQTDMKVDAGRYDAEAKSIRDLASTKVTYASKLAEAEGAAKIAIATIEGQANIDRAIKEGRNDVSISLERANNQRMVAGLRSDALYTVAAKQARITQDMSKVVLDQIANDAETERLHIVAMSAVDVDRYTQVQSREVAASVTDAAETVRHAKAMTGLNDVHLISMGKQQAEYILAAGQVGIKAAMDRYNEEARYIALETENRIVRLGSMTDAQLVYIAEQAGAQANNTKILADASSLSAARIIDQQYEESVNRANYLSDISTQVTEWSTSADATVGAYIRAVQMATADLSRYSVAYTNMWKVSSEGGEITGNFGGDFILPNLEWSAPSF